MEYLVTMTTQVPAGTSEAEVDDVKAREAAHSRELATDGRLLRLWRPPLQPGEWRTLGMFDAADRTELEAVLRSMPLRVWRTDDIVPLRPHSNDPGREAARPQSPAPPEGSSEFFTTFTATVPPDAPSQLVDEANAKEATRARNWPTWGPSSGFGNCRTGGERLGCGEPSTPKRCRRFWGRSRCATGSAWKRCRSASTRATPH